MLLIYDMCRYQKAWNLEQVSPWCAAFNSDDLKVTFAIENNVCYITLYRLSHQGFGVC